ncbi:ABC transporter ATP-binding protein [Bordetella petrii]|uniref:ABC transporter ATP-binding protein n=1 Tax=Bordetella petrii TaxID=94624 RepID=UPI001A9626E4|nr:ABC transporter ATP-binding protein [Bordetella petrii]MBO1110969.1 ABC transporter ATP-binding protein [Bordetella petrii]
MIAIENVTKSYRTNNGRYYVFRDLDFVIPSGKNIGIIGRNGAGKSTLMRLLGGLDMPDSGRVHSQASISWPVGLSGGFQGSLSGRDNVKFICRVYGKSTEEIKDKVRLVEDFAEIGPHFDRPVKTYSSGMKARVGFGLSLAFDFDYYLVDEALSVGDAHFRNKATDAFKTRIDGAKIILVTHGMNQIRRLCDYLILVEGGKLIPYEDVEAGIQAYLAL